MDIKNIEAVMSLVEKSCFNRFEYSEKDIKIVLEKSPVEASAQHAILQNVSPSVPKTAAGISIVGEKIDGVTVKSPVVGTLYRSKDPEAPPFVSEGSIVKKGETLCLIEAMKMYSEIESPCDGKVTMILFDDGDLAEYDKPLFIIEEAR